MTLNFPNKSRSYDEVGQRVRFTGYDGMFEVPFFVENEALGSTSADEARCLAAFDAACSRIHNAARKIYGGARRPRYVLTAADFR